MANENNIANLIAEQQASRDALNDYVRENRANGLNAEVTREHNDRIERADRAVFHQKQAQSERLANLSPEAWNAEKANFLDQVEFDDYQRRQRLS